MKWEEWRHQLPHLAKLKILRTYTSQELSKAKTVELHNFSDASMLGYGQCSYLRVVSSNDEVETQLVMSKSRVTPAKTVTIPRLELSAAVASVKVGEFLARELKIENLTQFYYSDSNVVLGYISNDSKRFHVFFANRVQQIRDLTSPGQWRHVATDINPADLASRGTTAGELMDSALWWKGPDFLSKLELPSAVETQVELSPSDPEVKRSVTVLQTDVKKAPNPNMIDRFESFSSWMSLKRAIALLKRRCTGKVDEGHTPNREVKSIQEAEAQIIRLVQECAFPIELKKLETEGNQGVGKNSPLAALDPFLDENAILRVGGRLKNSSMSKDEKHPVLLPRHGHVTHLIVGHYHRMNGHPGRGITLNSIRQAGYWIMGARSVVTSYIMKCVSCIKLRGAPLAQRMADLPEDRMESIGPFTYSGVDYFGPFTIREKRSTLKRWGVLFTCLASRAVHLEIANSLDTDAFLNAYRRFVCRRGSVRKLRCGRGTNFVGGKNELSVALAEMNKAKITEQLLKDNCELVEFEMNVPHASHMGGVWERMIRSVRSVLNGLLLKTGHQLDDELLHTLMTEVEAIVNSRPLTFIDAEDPNSPQPLCPSQLLTLKAKVVMPPPGHFVREDLYCRRRWRRVQAMANQFWQQWRTDFLPTLQERKKWVNPTRNVMINDIVLVIDEDQARCDWPLGRVIETSPGRDGLVRKVKLRVGKGTFERPIHKLVLLLRGETG
ncbi:uncharacterized protein LOC135484295 [Lineus longissimus]|uniref:uncharacterized protein LOC135484295 n=1 Tax=Lineus longissimus TaxID=88925 RepID=UPI00315C7C61